jgi:hypothetical protein
MVLNRAVVTDSQDKYQRLFSYRYRPPQPFFHRHRRHPTQQTARLRNINLQITAQTLHSITLAQQRSPHLQSPHRHWQQTRRHPGCLGVGYAGAGEIHQIKWIAP